MPTRRQARNAAYDPGMEYEASPYDSMSTPATTPFQEGFRSAVAERERGVVGGRPGQMKVIGEVDPRQSFSPFQQEQGPAPGTGAQKRIGGGLRTVSSTPRTATAGGGATGTRQTTTWTPPTGPRPEFEAPDYEPVEFDKRRLKTLRQRHAAPFRREAMKALQGAFTRSYGSKPERDMAIRNALNQYGTAYGKVMAQAEQTAQAEYAMERSELQQERILEFKAAMTKAQADFTSAWQTWSKSGTAISTAGPTGPSGELFRPYMTGMGGTRIDIATGMVQNPENLRVIRRAGL